MAGTTLNEVMALARSLDVPCTRAVGVGSENYVYVAGQTLSLPDAYNWLNDQAELQTVRAVRNMSLEEKAGYYRGKADVLLGNEDDPREIANYYYGVLPADLDNFERGYKRAQSEGVKS